MNTVAGANWNRQTSGTNGLSITGFRNDKRDGCGREGTFLRTTTGHQRTTVTRNTFDLLTSSL